MTIDIIIPNYNGQALLPTCLDALRRQTRSDFTITVVDDGSTDASLSLLQTHYPEVNVISRDRNGGLVAAINQGFRQTRCPYVVFLNNDTEAEPAWLEELVGALERFPDYAFAASKLRLWDRRDAIHSAGDGYAAEGRPYNRGVWQQDRGQFDAMVEVWGPCAGAAAYRRSALEALEQDGELLDSDLFMYCEDVDLNLRARLAGLRTVFVPRAVVYHQLSATGGGTLASYYCGRNFLAVWVKNMPAALARRYFIRFALYQLRLTLDALRHWRGAAARAWLRGQVAGLKALPVFLRKRKQRRQVVSNSELADLLAK